MDAGSFLQELERHQGIIHKICRIYRQTVEDREDLFQEIVFQLWRSAPGFRGEAAFSTWMYRIALSTAIATFRRKKPDIRYLPELPEHAEAPEPHSHREEALLEALSRLEPDEKALITLYLEDLSYREIAGITGLTENAVGARLSRLRKKIQQLINIEP